MGHSKDHSTKNKIMYIENAKQELLKDALDALNDMQKKAVYHFGSPLLIRAGAGSGKTRVITTKIAYLIEEKNVPPESILALTFTNKAAKEMQERATLISFASQRSMIKTFHSFGAWFLRRYGREAGLAERFTIYDVEASSSLLAHLSLRITKEEKEKYNFAKVTELKGSEQNKVFEVSLTRKEISYFYEKISRAKDYCLTPTSPNLNKIDSSDFFKSLYSEYEKSLRATGNADFGDLILLPYLILKEHPEIVAKMQKRFSVILVDEYQDTNVAQVEFLRMFLGDFQYLCVVGDEDQAIYRFRGAEIENILSFERAFEGTQMVTLQQNYRSFGNILKVANSIIRHNQNRFKKELYSVREEGAKTQVVIVENQDIEAAYATYLIEEYIKEGYGFGDWAIIYRTNKQSNVFESTFLHRGIPYVLIGAVEFFQREEIRDAISLLSIIANGKDEVALRRLILKYVAGIGEKKCNEIINASRAYIKNESLEPDISSDEDLIYAIPMIIKDIKRLNEATKNSILSFISKIKDLQDIIKEGKMVMEINAFNESFANTFAIFLDYAIKEIGLYVHYQEIDKKDKTDRLGNLNEFVNSASSYAYTYDALVEFLEYIELREELEAKHGQRYDESVKLMSMHTTKGLEFKNVIVTGLEKGLFPRFEHNINDVEEERRLMYVACTRAMDNLFITSCRYRRSFYSSGYVSPSMFLKEIDEELVDVYEIKYGVQKRISLNELFSNEEEKYQVGMFVEHREYGVGRIEKVGEVAGEIAIIVHFFNDEQKRRFLPSYTKDIVIRWDINIEA